MNFFKNPEPTIALSLSTNHSDSESHYHTRSVHKSSSISLPFFVSAGRCYGTYNKQFHGKIDRKHKLNQESHGIEVSDSHHMRKKETQYEMQKL